MLSLLISFKLPLLSTCLTNGDIKAVQEYTKGVVQFNFEKKVFTHFTNVVLQNGNIHTVTFITRQK